MIFECRGEETLLGLSLLVPKLPKSDRRQPNRALYIQLAEDCPCIQPSAQPALTSR